MKVDLIASQETKDKKALKDDNFYQIFISLPIEEAVTYYENLNKKDQEGIIARALINLLR